MAGLNLQSADRVDRFVAETALVPTACHSLTGGSSNPPKFGTLIPNRIFVGGIPSNSETLIFKDRKLNIGHAIRKQQMFPRADLPAALFFAGGAMPYSIQNGMAVFSLPGQEYPMLTQATAPYATMMLPQPGGGTTLYLPSAASATASPYAQLSQQQVTAALQQHQHYQTTGITGGIAPSVAGQLTPVTVSGSNMNAQSNNTAAVMAAAEPSSGRNSLQAAAMAAAVAAQQAAWRWSPTVQQAQTSHVTSSTHVSNTGSVTTASNAVGNTTSTPTIQNQSLHTHPQPLGFPCDGTPLGRHSQQLGGQLASAVGNQHLDTAACLSPYAAFAPLLDLQSHGSGSGQQNTLIHSTTLQHAFRQHHSASTTILATPQAASGQHIMPIAHAATSLVAQPQQHSKLYSSSILSSNAHTGPAVNACLYANPPAKISALSELTSPVDAQDASSLSQSSAVQTTAVSANGTGLSPHNTTVTQLQASSTASLNFDTGGTEADGFFGVRNAGGEKKRPMTSYVRIVWSGLVKAIRGT
ncbi:boule-related protein [Clonorchis sinensis]|uniref:Boule-related protein n=1 Tax=Clonorchis sinensis TaxID=79923 RepID=G7YLP7_CLOSI|nr:boule-related protein [Clonorchis sinensis]